MGRRIYLKELPCYQTATEIQKKRAGRNPSYDLDLLPTEQMKNEMEKFIRNQGNRRTLDTIYMEHGRYHHLCQFLQKRALGLESLLERDKEMWIHQLKVWMMAEGMPVTRSSVGLYGNKSVYKAKLISYFEKILDFLMPEDSRDETIKDVWRLDRLDIPVRFNPIKNYNTLNFTKISQHDLREETKKGIYANLKGEAIATVAKELTAIRRLSRFLQERYPELQSAADISREIFEEYLIYLKTEQTEMKTIRTDLGKLRSILETIGNVYGYRNLNGMILNRDIPPLPKAEFRVYSDDELKRYTEAVVKLDEQAARLMIIHQMLGTRISDTLTLQTDCLYEKNGVIIIRIKQMKTHIYEKPVNAELATLIQKAVQYTKERYGETRYIFVDEKNPEKPMQYGTIQTKVVTMLRKEKLKDDKGELFGFGSHMFRHFYGVKLTEMHLDDWTIAKLLGHSGVKNVRYYRKMSNQILADETRRARQKLSQIILENLEGWGKEYEEIRQNAGIE